MDFCQTYFQYTWGLTEYVQNGLPQDDFDENATLNLPARVSLLALSVFILLAAIPWCCGMAILNLVSDDELSVIILDSLGLAIAGPFILMVLAIRVLAGAIIHPSLAFSRTF